MRSKIDAGLTSIKPGSRYLDAHVDAVGKLGSNDLLGRAGLELGWNLRRNLDLYAEANALTDRTWNAGAGLRWRW